MIRIVLLLLGREVVQRRWWTLALAGGLWAFLGIALVIDALDGHTVIRARDFGYFLLVEGLLTLPAAFGSRGAARRLRLAKAGIFLLIVALVFSAHRSSHFALAMLFGTAFLVDGALRIASAHVVRFPGWRSSLAAGVVEILLGIATLQPWPTWYEATIGFNVGCLLAISGAGVLRVGWRLRNLPADAPLSALFGGAWSLAYPGMAATETPEDGMPVLTVHVWTPTGTATTPLHQRAVNRYVAAVDQNGVISTGHAALECLPDVYVSHYPAVEIDRSPSAFTQTLRAVRENDVPGRFQPSYAEEAADWCPSTVQVRFRNFDAARLRRFWNAYRRNETYNLTSRNCSSAVAHALDAALEGIYRKQQRPWSRLTRAWFSPELWVAGMLRDRAETMAWTPGLVLDYARALSALVEDPRSSWRLNAWLRLSRRGGERPSTEHGSPGEG